MKELRQIIEDDNLIEDEAPCLWHCTATYFKGSRSAYRTHNPWQSPSPAGKQPPRAASPLYLSGLTLVLFGAALYVAPVRPGCYSLQNLGRAPNRRPRCCFPQVLTSSLLGRILSPLSGLAGLPALPPVWRLALPALATAFGAQLQHLAASGSEREHTRYCRALAAGFVAAGASEVWRDH